MYQLCESSGKLRSYKTNVIAEMRPIMAHFLLKLQLRGLSGSARPCHSFASEVSPEMLLALGSVCASVPSLFSFPLTCCIFKNHLVFRLGLRPKNLRC